jgi:hypothetical protein
MQKLLILIHYQIHYTANLFARLTDMQIELSKISGGLWHV